LDAIRPEGAGKARCRGHGAFNRSGRDGARRRLFHRFALMRAWHEKDGVPFEAFLSPDQLHMNDWGYACIAKLLGGAIAEAATRPIAAVRVMKP
jgi:hypothetical protein